MAENDAVVVEILKKAIEGNIEKRVYDKIKNDILKLKVFGAAGVALLSLLILFHQLEQYQRTLLTYRTTIAETKSELGTERDKMQQVLESLINAREATLQRVGAAQKSADDVRQQLDDRITM
jgi:type VI protein secretion system component VasK